MKQGDGRIMARYHVKADGSMGVCTAREGNCPFGGEEGTRHFTSESEARAYSESINKDDLSTGTKTLRKNDSVTVVSVEDGDHSHDVDYDSLKAEVQILIDDDLFDSDGAEDAIDRIEDQVMALNALIFDLEEGDSHTQVKNSNKTKREMIDECNSMIWELEDRKQEIKYRI